MDTFEYLSGGDSAIVAIQYSYLPSWISYLVDQRKARDRGISADRAREGFLALEKFIRDARGGKKPVDGYYVTVWRLMLRYPELLAWEMLWTDSLRETYRAIYDAVKAVKPAAGVGWHIWHNNSFNPIYRAEQDLQELAKNSDFLKMVMYHNCGGERMASYVASVSRTMYGDVPPQELLDFTYRVLDFREGPLDRIPSSFDGRLGPIGLSGHLGTHEGEPGRPEPGSPPSGCCVSPRRCRPR